MNYFQRLFSITLTTIALLGSALAQSPTTDAPIGLVWGSTSAEVKARGIELKEIGETDFGKTYIASKMEKALADQSGALLSFGFNDKLWRVTINSRPFGEDPAGSAALQRYEELVGVLSEKYGKGSAVQRLGDSIYAQPAYFLAGIRGGQSKWFTNFDTSNLFIQIGLTAADSSTAGWRLIYENKLFKRDFEVSKRSREKGNL